MKRALLALGLLWSVVANAQFVPGQLLTAAELNTQFALYAPLGGATFTGPVTIPTLTITTTATLPAQAANTVLGNSTGSSASPTAVSVTNCAGTSSALNWTGGSGFSCNGSINALTLSGATFQSPGTIGGTSASSAFFTNLNANGTITFANGSLPLPYLATQAANTIVANATGSTASPTAITAPSCSTTSNALLWTTSSGLSCNTTINASTLGGATFASPGPIGSTTASTGAFTTLSTSGLMSANARLAVSDASNNQSTVAVTATGTNGAGITLTGNGATTPNKTIRVNGGTLQVCNSAYSLCPVGVSDTGNIQSTGGIDNTAIGAGTPSTGSFTTLASSGNFTPSQTNGIVGTTTNNNANAGSVGEYVSNFTTLTSATSATPLNATSVSLTAGDWDVDGFIEVNPAGTTTTASVGAGISTTSATFALITSGFTNFQAINSAVPAGSITNLMAPRTRLSLSATTTVYLVGQVIFGVSTLTVSGFIRARRVR